jgi:protease-4
MCRWSDREQKSNHPGVDMKNRWIWVGLAVVVGSVLLFAIAVYIVSKIIGEDQRLVVGGGVGLVEVRGLIVDSQETVKQLHDFARDDHVKAVVLRIESPGGVVGPSQEIYAEVKKLAGRKKVVVSMGSVAASGGYYIAVPANVIFANPGTITGSIGVLMKFTNVEGLMGKIGMKAFTLKTGKFKDAGSPLRPMSDEEKAMLQGVIDSTQGQFVNAVAEGRKLPREQVASIADGRIFTGEQAREVKLVDKLGTLQDAIDEAGKLAGIKGEPQLIRPPKKKKLLLDLLAEETASRIGTLVRKESGLNLNGFSVNYEVYGAGD